MAAIHDKIKQDEATWDRCADQYEQQIVAGHPDIVGYEAFEEDLLDRILRHLAGSADSKLKVLDIGCGSGRLHVRYGAKCRRLSGRDDDALARLKYGRTKYYHDPLLAARLGQVWGIDFSARMIDLAREKLASLGLEEDGNPDLVLAKGSAFDLEEDRDGLLPVAVCLVNSIGVMQGREGAGKLFSAMRRLVEAGGGIAMISCFQREYLSSHGLNQYESTMDVSGPPTWLADNPWFEEEVTLVPHKYKRAFDIDSGMDVDVRDEGGKVLARGVRLVRDPERVARVLTDGHILTHHGYESNWYSFTQVGRWAQELWGSGVRHLPAGRLDAIRALPAQVAIYDPRGRLDGLFRRWGIPRRAGG